MIEKMMKLAIENEESLQANEFVFWHGMKTVVMEFIDRTEGIEPDG